MVADTQSGPRQVLLAEDEPIVRDMIQMFLHSWGYCVFSVRNGREAMDFAEEHQGEIDLLVSDVTMPQMGGLELAARLKAKHPGLQVILLSGYSHTQFVLKPEWKFIHKPFLSHELKAAVEESLKAKGDPCFLDGDEPSTFVSRSGS